MSTFSWRIVVLIGTGFFVPFALEAVVWGASIDGDEPSRALSGNRNDELSIRIDRPREGRLEYDVPLVVVLTNSSDHSISIWNPLVRNGYPQLSFRFKSVHDGKEFVARKNTTTDIDWLFRSHKNSIDAPHDLVQIEAKREFRILVWLNGIQGSTRTWGGLPPPNNDTNYLVSAEFHSDVPLAKSDVRKVWNGRVLSEVLQAKIVSSRLKTAADYLRNGFEDKAIEILKANAGESRDATLLVAARYGHAMSVKWLLENGASANATGLNGYTALHGVKNVQVIRLLLEQKPDLNKRDTSGLTAPQSAAKSLAEARNRVQEKQWQAVVDEYRNAGVKFDLLTAISLGDLGRVKEILADTPEFADDFHSQSPLRVAASAGQLEICRYLVEQHNVDLDDFERGAGYPIIKEALKYPEIVKLLIAHGADLETRITWRGFRTGVWLIGDHATVLHYAAKDGVPETVELLIRNGSDVFAISSQTFGRIEHDQTALDVAALFGRGDNASVILEHPRFREADEEVRQQVLNRCLLAGVNSMSRCDDADRFKLIEMLLICGADPTSSGNGSTAMKRATSQIHPNDIKNYKFVQRVCKLLVENGAQPDLYSAISLGDAQLVSRLLRANPGLVQKQDPGYPKLHFAVKMNYKNIVKQLLESGYDVDTRNRSTSSGTSGGTALHAAAFWGRNEIAEQLIKAGAGVNAMGDRKSTPLHGAARMGNVRIVKILLAHGANPNAKDEEGKAPRSGAIAGLASDEINRLLRASASRERRK